MKLTKLSLLAGTATGALFLAGCTIPGQQLQNREQEQTQEQVQNEMKEMADKLPDFTDETTVQEYEDQGYRVNCQKRNVADSEFTPPSNIQFQDYSALMQDAQKMGQNALEAVDQDQMKELQRQAEEMQKKYGQQ